MNPEPQKKHQYFSCTIYKHTRIMEKKKKYRKGEDFFLFIHMFVCVYIYINWYIYQCWPILARPQSSQSQPPPRPAIGWRPAGRPELRKVGALRGGTMDSGRDALHVYMNYICCIIYYIICICVLMYVVVGLCLFDFRYFRWLDVQIYIYHTAAAIFSRLWQVVPSADTSAITIEKEVATLQVPVVQCSCNSH